MERGTVSNYRNKISKMISDAAEEDAARYIEAFENAQEKCESPIEELLLAALYIENSDGIVRLEFMSGRPKEQAFFDQAAFVYQQAEIGSYRVDFLIHDATLPFSLGKPRWIVVECDGHDFHEKTKKQARRDKQRDRFLQARGYRVLRFTGSEIWQDAERCADEILDNLAALAPGH